MNVVALGPGTRLRSAVCSTEVVVVKAPSDGGSLLCGGESMQLLEAGAVAAPVGLGAAAGTLLGKRYEDPESGLEVLCTKGGSGTLAFDDRPLVLKGTKPLPSSD